MPGRRNPAVALPGSAGAVEPEMSTTRRLHVLHVSGTASGAVAAVVLDGLREQIDRGWTVTLACPSDGPLGFAARLAGARVRWWDPGSRPVAGIPGAVRRLAGVVAEARPDVVHLHAPEAGLVGRALLRDRLPTVVQPHGHRFTGALAGASSDGSEDDPSTARRRWERRAAGWTAEVVCDDRAEALHWAELGVGSDRITVIAPGIDVTRWRTQGPADRSAARRAHRLGHGPVAVCVGGLSLCHGQQDLLLEWPGVRDRVPGARLVLVGDGPDRGALQRLAADVSGVRLVGERTDVPSWLAAADVVVAPSRSPGLPRAALEAMASARSIVVTGVAGVAGTVPPGAGAVVLPGDGPALTEAVVLRLLDPVTSDEEGLRGRAHVERHHDSADAARELARIYPRLAAARRR